LAAVALGTALVAYAVALGSYLGIGPAVSSPNEAKITTGAALMGHWMLLVGVVSYGRFVVLDAQGLIPQRKRERAVSKQVKVAKDREVKHVASRSTAAASGPLRSFRESLQRSAPVESKAAQWIDGSEPETDSYNDGDGDGDGNEADFGGRRLSKAERKRLRKQKRAA
jgi:hypothetical protein